jgi:hypothetical protein
MHIVNVDDVRLVPGQSIIGLFSRQPGDPAELGLFIRSTAGVDPEIGGVQIRQRAGLIRFNDVLLVLTMIRIEGSSVEIFDIWWNYYSRGVSEQFQKMSEQERLTVYFYSERGKLFSLETDNAFRRFFSQLPSVIEKTGSWTEVEFDRAVRGFCAQSYPKENLWEMMEAKQDDQEPTRTGPIGIDDYPGLIPEELHGFYRYIPGQGHSISIIPSNLEDEAVQGDPERFLFPAPVRTVLRCGIRWTKGYPVAPIPFIPGHGLAVPPDDSEL